MELFLIKQLEFVTGGSMLTASLPCTSITSMQTCIDRLNLRKYYTFILEKALTFTKFQNTERESTSSLD
jgi:hypothetical protein